MGDTKRVNPDEPKIVVTEEMIDAAIHWTPTPYEIDTEDRNAYEQMIREILKIYAA